MNLVQAALGPVALDLARSQEVRNEEQLTLAKNVLVISVLAIITTAPLGKCPSEMRIQDEPRENLKLQMTIASFSTGALLMTKLAPKWLKRENQTDGTL